MELKQYEPIQKAVKKQRKYFNRDITKELEFRKQALDRLERSIKKYERVIYRALRKDLNKSAAESYMTEVGVVLSELRFIKKNFCKWTGKKMVCTPLAQFPAKSFTISEPLGVVLIMAPWNYPFQLCISPLIGAIAAGNCCILKPSEYAPHTSRVLSAMIQETFSDEYVTVLGGDAQVSEVLLEQRFDYIFFTGSVNVGKVVMGKAAKNLTPVTLELGGKSPGIVDRNVNLKIAARRIAFGKFLNSGQTCVAPDYILVHKEVKTQFLTYLKAEIIKMYGENPLENNDYTKIINERHFNRLQSLLTDSSIIIGGRYNKKMKKIEPTVIDGSDENAPVMKEEIFGPILPIVTFERHQEVMRYIRNKEKPLALYLFTNDKYFEDEVLKRVSFGGGCINDTIIHLATSEMGFGGVGHSGMGRYHGKMSFDTFSHKKSIVKKAEWLDIPMRYQPYSKLKEKCIRAFLR